MNFSRMKKDRLVHLAREYRLPHPDPASLKVGHLREMMEAHFPQYLELWFLSRVRTDLMPSANILAPARNAKHLPHSQLEFDFSWKSLRLAVEIQGGLKHSRSGHRSEAGVRRDMAKVNLAQLNGWLLLQLSPEQISQDHIWARETLPMLKTAITVCRGRMQ